jgi:hypothetical protein
VRLKYPAQVSELVFDLFPRRALVKQVYRGGFKLRLHCRVAAFNRLSKRFEKVRSTVVTPY